MKKNKKRQHYVWKNYLKPWTLDNKIWCKRKDKIFNTSLDCRAHAELAQIGLSL